MSVIIRLQGLSWSASAMDIRHFFKGLAIPPGGVHIIGGERGDAFIAFSSDEDARQAMLLNNGILNESPVQLFLSSKTEMQTTITQAKEGPSTKAAAPAVTQPSQYPAVDPRVTDYQRFSSSFPYQQPSNETVASKLPGTEQRQPYTPVDPYSYGSQQSFRSGMPETNVALTTDRPNDQYMNPYSQQYPVDRAKQYPEQTVTTQQEGNVTSSHSNDSFSRNYRDPRLQRGPVADPITTTSNSKFDLAPGLDAVLGRPQGSHLGGIGNTQPKYGETADIGWGSREQGPMSQSGTNPPGSQAPLHDSRYGMSDYGRPDVNAQSQGYDQGASRLDTNFSAKSTDNTPWNKDTALRRGPSALYGNDVGRTDLPPRGFSDSTRSGDRFNPSDPNTGSFKPDFQRGMPGRTDIPPAGRPDNIVPPFGRDDMMYDPRNEFDARGKHEQSPFGEGSTLPHQGRTERPPYSDRRDGPPFDRQDMHRQRFGGPSQFSRDERGKDDGPQFHDRHLSDRRDVSPFHGRQAEQRPPEMYEDQHKRPLNRHDGPRSSDKYDGPSLNYRRDDGQQWIAGQRDRPLFPDQKDVQPPFGRQEGRLSFGKQEHQAPPGRSDGQSQYGRQDGQPPIGREYDKPSFAQRQEQMKIGKQERPSMYGDRERPGRFEGPLVRGADQAHGMPNLPQHIRAQTSLSSNTIPSSMPMIQQPPKSEDVEMKPDIRTTTAQSAANFQNNKQANVPGDKGSSSRDRDSSDRERSRNRDRGRDRSRDRERSRDRSRERGRDRRGRDRSRDRDRDDDRRSRRDRDDYRRDRDRDRRRDRDQDDYDRRDRRRDSDRRSRSARRSATPEKKSTTDSPVKKQEETRLNTASNPPTSKPDIKNTSISKPTVTSGILSKPTVAGGIIGTCSDTKGILSQLTVTSAFVNKPSSTITTSVSHNLVSNASVTSKPAESPVTSTVATTVNRSSSDNFSSSSSTIIASTITTPSTVNSKHSPLMSMTVPPFPPVPSGGQGLLGDAPPLRNQIPENGSDHQNKRNMPSQHGPPGRLLSGPVDMNHPRGLGPPPFEQRGLLRHPSMERFPPDMRGPLPPELRGRPPFPRSRSPGMRGGRPEFRPRGTGLLGNSPYSGPPLSEYPPNMARTLPERIENVGQEPPPGYVLVDEFGNPVDQNPSRKLKYVVFARGMPLSVTYKEVRKFFFGCDIPRDGLKLINDNKGRRVGTAYIQFGNEESFKRALTLSGTKMDRNTVTVTQCSWEDFDNAVDSFVPSLNDPEDFARSELKVEPQKKTNPPIVRVEGLPPSVTKNAIQMFFSNCMITQNGEAVFIEKDASGHCTGKAYAEFINHESCNKAIGLSQKKMGENIIQVQQGFREEIDQMMEEQQKLLESKAPDGNQALKQQTNSMNDTVNRDHGDGCDNRNSTEMNSRPPLDCLQLQNIPPDITGRDLRNIFQDLGRDIRRIQICHDGVGNPTGDAYIECSCFEVAERGLTRNGIMLGPFRVMVKIINKPEMIENLRLARNYHLGGGRHPPHRSIPRPPPLPSPPRPQQYYFIKAGNLPKGTSIGEIMNFFYGYHPVPESVKLDIGDVKDKEDTSTAMIGFRVQEEAERAISNINGNLMRNNDISLMPLF